MQDVFLEVHRCLATWEGRSALLTWMFGIAHHQLCRRFRKKTPIGMPSEQLEASPLAGPEAPSDRRVEAARERESELVGLLTAEYLNVNAYNISLTAYLAKGAAADSRHRPSPDSVMVEAPLIGEARPGRHRCL